MFWPSYKQKTKTQISLSQVAVGIVTKGFLKKLLLMTVLYGAYISAILYLTIPGADKSVASDLVANWWLLDFIDKYFTGGAISNASVLSLGNFAVVPMWVRFIITRQDLDKAKKTTIGEVVVLSVVILFFITWYLRNGIIVPNLRSFISVAIYLVIGTIFIKYFFYELLKRRIGHINHIFIMLIIYSFIFDKIRTGETSNIIILGLLIMNYLIFNLFVRKKRIDIPVYNLSGKTFTKSSLVLPYLDFKYIAGLFGGTIFYTILISSLLNFFGITAISFYNDQIYLYMIMITVTLIIFYTHGYDNIMSCFDPLILENKLKSNFWVIDGLRLGSMTREYLRGLKKYMLKRSYYALILLISLIFVIQYYFQFFEYGVIGLMLCIFVVSEFIFLRYEEAKHQGGKKLISKYSWEYGNSAGQSFQVLELEMGKQELSVQAIVTSLFKEEHWENIEEIMAESGESKLQFVKLFYKYLIDTKEEDTSYRKLIINSFQILLACLLFCIFVASIVVVLSKFVFPNASYTENEIFNYFVTFIVFWLGSSLTFIFGFHPDMKKIRNKKADKIR